MNTYSEVPPGFRFHPSDEELVDYYLRKKVASKRIDLDVIKEVDLYKIEPWDLQEVCKIGSDDENEWYFFSHKDKKYPTGTRTNRATKAGFWKATGRDKAIYMRHRLVGMRKTLVFYKGRAPNGHKSDWIMHEYRLQTHQNEPPQEEGWAVCRVFKKRIATTVRRMCDFESPYSWFDDQPLDSPNPTLINNPYHHHQNRFAAICKQELELSHNIIAPDPFFQIPQLESPKVLIVTPLTSSSSSSSSSQGDNNQQTLMNSLFCVDDDQATDWRVLDKFVASQLSHDDVFLEADQVNKRSQILSSTSLTSHVDLWK